jgi:hypothetical protein
MWWRWGELSAGAKGVRGGALSHVVGRMDVRMRMVAMSKEWSVVVGEVVDHNDVGIARASATDGFGLGLSQSRKS